MANATRLTLATVAALFLVASRADAAAGTVDLSWNACSPLVADLNPAGSGPVSLYASVTGHSDPHTGYEVWAYFGDADDMVPDAWEFYDGGCQGSSRIQIDHLPPAETAAGCPALQGAGPSLQIKNFRLAPVGSGYPVTMGNFYVANAYPNGSASTDPNQRYFMARFLFDHTNSVPGTTTKEGECGGYERSLCFFLDPARCNYVTTDGVEMRFEVGQDFVTFRGECKSVPAANSTWGQIKGQYRR
jgi:hypothetical protein